VGLNGRDANQVMRAIIDDVLPWQLGLIIPVPDRYALKWAGQRQS
jgi:hypothetical protein